ncbi:MAG: 50S ribosomal protein L11 methyltransferase [Eubacterium sp.]|nr:50S ribosomal protein L11 methyltransferase [Eubacterium sp.]
MKWEKYTVATTTAAEDIISAMLAELGIEGVEIENNVPLTDEEAGDMFIDFPPELPPDDGTSRVSFYLEAGEDHEALLARVHAALEAQRQYLDIGSGEITKSQTEDADWMNNWKQFFKSFTVGEILIKPTWEERSEKDTGKILIEIDPGISFGTGKHETTQLCIRQLQKYAKMLEADGLGWKALDVGCGSGILSIVALKLGAASVTGMDIDENCIVSAQENMHTNRLDEALWHFYRGNLIGDKSVQERETDGYEIVLANILADVIIPMAPALFSCLKKGGVLITSGIIDFKEQDVAKALEGAGFELLETNRQGEWVNITARRK